MRWRASAVCSASPDDRGARSKVNRWASRLSGALQEDSMATLTLVDRLLQLLQHFALERAHVAAAVPGDWRGLATAHAERIASLTMVCPTGIDPALAAVASRAQLIHGDQGPIAERARAAVGRMPEVALVTLAGYAGLVWSDVCAERGGEMLPALLDFVRRM